MAVLGIGRHKVAFQCAGMAVVELLAQVTTVTGHAVSNCS